MASQHNIRHTGWRHLTGSTGTNPLENTDMTWVFELQSWHCDLWPWPWLKVRWTWHVIPIIRCYDITTRSVMHVNRCNHAIVVISKYIPGFEVYVWIKNYYAPIFKIVSTNNVFVKSIKCQQVEFFSAANGAPITLNKKTGEEIMHF